MAEYSTAWLDPSLEEEEEEEELVGASSQVNQIGL